MVQMHARKRKDSSHGPEGRARHSVRAAAWQWASGAQGTDAPYRPGWFMATMRDFEIVEAFHEPLRSRRGNEAETLPSRKIRLVTSAATKFILPMRAQFFVEAFQEPSLLSNFQSQRDVLRFKKCIHSFGA